MDQPFTSPLEPGERVPTMSDERLHHCFRTIGTVHQAAARHLIGMQGELDRRGVPARAGYTSLAHYSNVEGGLTGSQIDLALRLDRATVGLPCLRDLFQHGQVSLHKLRVVLGVATPELDAEIADQVQKLSKSKLEAWAREL